MAPNLLCPFHGIRAFGDYIREIFLIGHKVDNSLLLLGQYSDDELEEGSKKRVTSAVMESSSADHNDQVKGLIGSEDVDIKAGEHIASQEVKQQDTERDGTSLDALQNLEGRDIRENDATTVSDSSKEMDLDEQIYVPGNPGAQGTGDVTLGWKMVMHEESNQCYYWNTETGETSWEVPDVLVQASQLNPEQKTLPVTEGMESACLGHDEVKSTLDVECSDSSAVRITCVSVGANLISETKEVCEHVSQVNEHTEDYKGETFEVKDGATGINQSELSSFDAVNDLLGNGSSIRTGLEKYAYESIVNKELETGIDISSRLVEQSESLLEKLMTLKGLMSHPQGHDLTSKYIWELEIRISDFKSLLSYGSSLLPFWEHSERQIKRLEVVVDDQICQFAKYAENEVDTHIKRDKSLESMVDAYEADGNEKKVVSKVEISTTVLKDSQGVATNDNIAISGHISSCGYPTTFAGNGSEANSGRVDGNDLSDEFTFKPGLHAEEDVDMDVDMEVDDTVPSSNAAAQNPLGNEYFPPQEQSIQPNLPVEYSSLASEDGFTIPPPPGEEWIPPPPPDNEIIPPPPPPPDEPPEPAYPPPPSYPETAEAVPYTGQYNLSYPDSNFDYYGHTVAEVPSSSFYGLAEGHQVAMPHPPVYYDTVPNVYLENALVMVNPVEPGAYYGVQDGMVPPVAVVSSVESSGLHSGSGPVSYDTLASDQTGTSEQTGATDAPAEVGCSSLSNRNVDVPAVGCHAEMASAEVAFSSATIQAPATILVKESAPVPSTNVVTGAPASTGSKAQSKASRTEKRTIGMTSSLRSNKKVSSLVDKWKAAKEELHEDEESEPENGFEILEKKRQRAIEEWRAQQIASGEAKDNANFQPLGGDWRERVRRKRARKSSEAKKSSPEPTAYKSQQPDLVELSRDLPSGWQAYWDESTKLVYYGNAVTSETTWTRPTN